MNPDIIMGTETWFDPNIKSSEILPEYQHFDIARRNRPSKPLSDAISRYVWFVPTVYWFELIVCSDQFISGRLKSPASTNMSFLCLDIASDNGLEQIVDFPTRNENTLDLIFTSHPSYKQRCKPIPAIGNSVT
jgi:hypothetical protein